MDFYPDLQKLTISLGIGLLIGIQRERADSQLAGVRTFPLIAMAGTVSALLSLKFGGWVLALGLVAMAVTLFAGNMLKMRQADVHPGLTTEIAALLMFGVGAYLVVGYIPVALAVGGAMATLLHFKAGLHKFVDRLGDEDARAIAQLALIALVILPILPNKSFGPYQVINPFEIWTVVVLIVSIGMGAYVCYRLFGTKAGTLLGGILGGLISSTATTVSYARYTKKKPQSSTVAAVVAAIASTVVFARIIVEILFVAPEHAAVLIPPIAAMFIVMSLIAALLYFRNKDKVSDQDAPSNPADLKGALLFGLIYSVIIFAVAATKDLLGTQALYVVSVVSGLTDVDALTLSTTQLVKQNRLGPEIAWQLILIGALSNLVFKTIMVFSFADMQMAKTVLKAFAVAIAAGVALLLAWNHIAAVIAMRSTLELL